MAEKQRIMSGAPWEPLVGYSRAIRVGKQVFVSGTAPVGEDGMTVGIGDAYAQAKHCIDILENSLHQAGAELRHVVRTRIFVTDIARWEDVGRAHAEFFGDIRPATSMVEVARLIGPDMLVEIEADAIIDD